MKDETLSKLVELMECIAEDVVDQQLGRSFNDGAYLRRVALIDELLKEE